MCSATTYGSTVSFRCAIPIGALYIGVVSAKRPLHRSSRAWTTETSRRPKATRAPRRNGLVMAFEPPTAAYTAGLHIEYHDLPGSHCECGEADTMEVVDGVALMMRTAPEDSSSDDDGLPMYTCALYNDAIVLGGGGVLECATCRSH